MRWIKDRYFQVRGLNLEMKCFCLGPNLESPIWLRAAKSETASFTELDKFVPHPSQGRNNLKFVQIYIVNCELILVFTFVMKKCLSSEYQTRLFCSPHMHGPRSKLTETYSWVLNICWNNDHTHELLCPNTSAMARLGINLKSITWITRITKSHNVVINF